MPDKCTDTCPLVTRVEALEEANKNHSRTHEGMYDRIRALETENAVQEAHYTTILGKLDELTSSHKELNKRLSELESKPGKRWDTVVEKVLLLVVGALVGLVLVRLGLSA